MYIYASIDLQWHLMASNDLTLLENLQLCPKIQFSEKSPNGVVEIFVPKLNDFL